MNEVPSDCADGHGTIPRKKRKVLVFPEYHHNWDLKYDEDDFLVVCDTLLRFGLPIDFFDAKSNDYLSALTLHDGGHRVTWLSIDGYSSSPRFSLPLSMNQLENLSHLTLKGIKLTSFPFCVEWSKKLQYLVLDCRDNVALPPSLWELQNLKYLNIWSGENLSELPEEIGNLIGLNSLDISCKGISSIPSSLTRIQALTKLKIYSRKMTQVPEVIFDLVSLSTLHLSCHQITSLPSSIGALRNLKHLDLCGTKNLENLPEEVGVLTNLSTLNLINSGITSLPTSFRNLTRLNILLLKGTPLARLEKNDMDNFLWTLVQNHRWLDCLGKSVEGGQEKLGYALACNRARCRTHELIHETPGSWAHLLNKASDIFRRSCRSSSSFIDDFFHDGRGHYEMKKNDAIYEILRIGMGSFIRILINHSTKKAL